MSEKKQLMRFSDDELALIKSVFAENDDLLKAIRKLMLQINLSANDLAALTVNLKEDVLKVLRKEFLPTIEGNEPVQQIMDLWMMINIKDRMYEDAVLTIKANKKFIDYIQQQFALLEDIENLQKNSNKLKLKLEDLTDIEDKLDKDMFIDICARNTIIYYVEGRIQDLYSLALRKEETPEEQAKRLEKNSSK